MDVIWQILIILGIILVSMTLHEAVHGFVAYWLGDDTAKLQGRLTLNPVRHIDPFLTILLPLMLAAIGGPIFGGARPVQFNPTRLRGGEWGTALVAVAGPLTNFLLAFVSFGIWVLAGHETDTLLGQIFYLAVVVNLGFFVFNMVPIPPLDGSRLLYALAPDFVRRGMEAIEQFGIITILVVVLLAGSMIGLAIGSSIGFFIDVFNHIFALGPTAGV